MLLIIMGSAKTRRVDRPAIKKRKMEKRLHRAVLLQLETGFVVADGGTQVTHKRCNL